MSPTGQLLSVWVFASLEPGKLLDVSAQLKSIAKSLADDMLPPDGIRSEYRLERAGASKAILYW
jgi:hypothetical protein